MYENHNLLFIQSVFHTADKKTLQLMFFLIWPIMKNAALHVRDGQSSYYQTKLKILRKLVLINLLLVNQ